MSARPRVNRDRFAAWRTPLLAAAGLLLLVAVLKFLPGDVAEAGGEPPDGAAAASQEPFAIRVIWYPYTERNIPIAQATGRAVRALFPGQPDPQLTLFPQGDPDVIELWLGEAQEAAALQALLHRVQESSVETDPNNPRPFASARIERRRAITAP